MTFKEQIQQGIPTELPNVKPYETAINHAPKRKDILTEEEKKLALKNALRYFDAKHQVIYIQIITRENPIAYHHQVLLYLHLVFLNSSCN